MGEFKFKEYNRQVNHIVALLDAMVIMERIEKDDLSAMKLINGFTPAQIKNYITAAERYCANNVFAALLEYAHKTFPDYDPLAK